MITFFISPLVDTFLGPARQSVGLLKSLKAALTLRLQRSEACVFSSGAENLILYRGSTLFGLRRF